MDQTNANAKIVRISDFCKRSTTSRRRRRKESITSTSTVGAGLENGDTSFLSLANSKLDDTFASQSPSNLSIDIEGRIPGSTHNHSMEVSVVILKSLPCLNNDDPSQRGNQVSDEYATVYTEDIQLLLELQVFNGQVCMMSRTTSTHTCTPTFVMEESQSSINKRTNSNHGASWIPVIIIVIPRGSISTFEFSPRESLQLRSDSHSKKYRVYMPPTIALSLGVHEYGCLSLQVEARIARIHTGTRTGSRSKILTSPKPFTQTKIPDALPMAMATKAKIMEISSPPDDFTPSMKTMFMSQDKVALRRWLEDQKSCQIDTLQQYFYRRNGTRNGNGAKGEKREAVSRLMTVGTIFAVVDEKVCSKTIDKFDMKLRSSIRFYKIVEIETEMGILQQYNANMSMSGGNEDFCWISPETQLVLLPKEDSKLVHVSRMTQFSSTWSFSQSVQNSSTSTYTYSSFVRKAWSHPSLVNVVQSIFSTGSLGLNLCRNNVGSNSSLESHLIHVIGNEDDHVKLCLDAAADSVGMNILHVDGLVSFAHRYKATQLEETAGGASIVGTILDKIAGIRAAFTVARRSTPCIVHIRLDQEIIDTDDTEARHDEESRLLSCLREASLDVYKEMEGVDVPPVLVIISTEKEFEHGPLSSSIIYDSVSIESPNESYARENWNDNDSFDEVKHELLGRSANEIYFWGKEFRRKKRDMMCSHQPLPTSSFSAKEMLMSIMNCSASRVTMFHSSSKKLTSDLIPNVKWEDIGGLSHVRSEIIDAIELPLQHPDLFKGSSRRSGILFFGPPGSGKTLVAKAVASECGLPFLSIKGPELLGSYVGESESNIRAAFASAREAAADSVHENSTGAAILFFDEIDSLAPRRGELGDGGGVMERVVSTLLAEMDKDVDPHENPGQVFVIGATNRPDLLDPSLLRPGRFDRIVYLGLAKSREDRIQILAAQTRKFQFENGVDAFAMASKVIDAIPSSMSGADFSAVASGALMLALQRLCDEVDNEVSSNSSPDSNIEDVVAMWPEERLVPKVKVEDFIAAAEKIHPSVSDDDIQKYEAMRNEYCALGRH